MMHSGNSGSSAGNEGSHWKPDDRNLSGLRPLGEAADAVPASTRFVRDDVRSLVRKAITPEGSAEHLRLPPYPQDRIHSAEDLFSRALEEVDRLWSTAHVDEAIGDKCSEWRTRLSGENDDLRTLLTESAEVMESMRSRSLGALEELRTVLPEAWDTLNQLASERQLQAQILLRHWARNFPADEGKRIGLSGAELQLFLDCSLLQKFTDTAYAKQRWLSDRPGGTRTTKLGRDPVKQAAAPWVYEVIPEGEQYRYAQDEEEDLLTEARGLGEMFPFEWSHVAQKIRRLADETEKKIDGSVLPAHYRTFVSYLRKLSAFLQAQQKVTAETDPVSLARLMADAFREGVHAYRAGCKVVMLFEAVPTVAGDANKQDIGMRLGIVTPEFQQSAKALEPSRIVAQERYRRFIGANGAQLLSIPPEVPPVVLSQEIFGSGPNLHFRVGGTNGPQRIDLHPNFIREEAQGELKRLAILFPALDDIPPERYGYEALQHYAGHEEAHSLFATEDAKTGVRIGLGAHGEDGWILEELKAEAESASIRKEMLERQHASPDAVRLAFAAKLGSIVTIVATSAEEGVGERYFFSGLLLLRKLLDGGIIAEEADHYCVTDPEKGLGMLAAVGDEVIEKFYADPEAQPEAVGAFVQSIRLMKENPRVQKFIAAAKAA
ncbi:MAG: hypothetical protein PHE68_01875 [Candidatus Peribacteraceae bacterium]|nr:hypothetical protein [Candidatus Peribacteraceae bacterium]MDD5074653.1 hypothetical protein [Candidatus Peribacteraceae bacterium]